MIHWINPLPFFTALLYFFGKKRDRRAEACQNFRSAFLHELEGLYPLPTNWPKGTGIEPTLRKAFPVLQAAIAEFRFYVPDDQKNAFDLAWRDYRCLTKREVDAQDYTHYMNMASEAFDGTTGQTFRSKTDGKSNLKRNVDRLLEFAKDV